MCIYTWSCPSGHTVLCYRAGQNQSQKSAVIRRKAEGSKVSYLHLLVSPSRPFFLTKESTSVLLDRQHGARITPGEYGAISVTLHFPVEYLPVINTTSYGKSGALEPQTRRSSPSSYGTSYYTNTQNEPSMTAFQSLIQYDFRQAINVVAHDRISNACPPLRASSYPLSIRMADCTPGPSGSRWFQTSKHHLPTSRLLIWSRWVIASAGLGTNEKLPVRVQYGKVSIMSYQLMFRGARLFTNRPVAKMIRNSIQTRNDLRFLL